MTSLRLPDILLNNRVVNSDIKRPQRHQEVRHNQSLPVPNHASNFVTSEHLVPEPMTFYYSDGRRLRAENSPEHPQRSLPARISVGNDRHRKINSAPSKKENAVNVGAPLPKINNFVPRSGFSNGEINQLLTTGFAGVSTKSHEDNHAKSTKFASSWAQVRAENHFEISPRPEKSVPDQERLHESKHEKRKSYRKFQIGDIKAESTQAKGGDRHTDTKLSPFHAVVQDIEEDDAVTSQKDAGQPGQTGQTGKAGQSGQPGQTGQTEQQGQPGQTGQTKKAGQSGQPGQTEQTGQQGQPGQTGKAGKPGQTGKTGQPGQPGQTGQTGKAGQPGQPGQTGKAGQPGQTEEKREKPTHSQKAKIGYEKKEEEIRNVAPSDQEKEQDLHKSSNFYKSRELPSANLETSPNPPVIQETRLKPPWDNRVTAFPSTINQPPLTSSSRYESELTYKPTTTSVDVVYKTYTGHTKKGLGVIKDTNNNALDSSRSLGCTSIDHEAEGNSSVSESISLGDYVLSRNEAKMYLHVRAVYGSDTYRQQRKKWFLEKAMALQTEELKQRAADQRIEKQRQLNRKLRQQRQLMYIRRKFRKQQLHRFRTQYVTSRVLQYERSDNNSYGLPAYVDEGYGHVQNSADKGQAKFQDDFHQSSAKEVKGDNDEAIDLVDFGKPDDERNGEVKFTSPQTDITTKSKLFSAGQTIEESNGSKNNVVLQSSTQTQKENNKTKDNDSEVKSGRQANIRSNKPNDMERAKTKGSYSMNDRTNVNKSDSTKERTNRKDSNGNILNSNTTENVVQRSSNSNSGTVPRIVGSKQNNDDNTVRKDVQSGASSHKSPDHLPASTKNVIVNKSSERNTEMPKTFTANTKPKKSKIQTDTLSSSNGVINTSQNSNTEATGDISVAKMSNSLNFSTSRRHTTSGPKDPTATISGQTVKPAQEAESSVRTQPREIKIPENKTVSNASPNITKLAEDKNLIQGHVNNSRGSTVVPSVRNSDTTNTNITVSNNLRTKKDLTIRRDNVVVNENGIRAQRTDNLKQESIRSPAAAHTMNVKGQSSKDANSRDRLPKQSFRGVKKDDTAVQQASKEKQKRKLTSAYERLFDVKIGPTRTRRSRTPKMEGIDTVVIKETDKEGRTRSRKKGVKDVLKEAKKVLDLSEDADSTGRRQKTKAARESNSSRPPSADTLDFDDDDDDENEDVFERIRRKYNLQIDSDDEDTIQR